MSYEYIPVVDVPEFTSDTNEYVTEYKRSIKWDPSKGDFVRDGANKIIESPGVEAFATWCYKVAQTERSRCMAYDDAIGTEMERAMQDDDAATVESMVKRTITEALYVNPRTEYVGDFVFEWNGDSMRCQFVVKGLNFDDEIIITI